MKIEITDHTCNKYWWYADKVGQTRNVQAHATNGDYIVRILEDAGEDNMFYNHFSRIRNCDAKILEEA